MTDETGAEIATIERTMKTDFGAYQRDSGMQARYGELLEAREAAGPASAGTASAVDTEITQIEERIRSDNPGYQADKALQNRYLQLLEAREDGGATNPLSSAPAGREPDFGNPAEVLSDYQNAGAYQTAEVLARGGTHNFSTNVNAIQLAALDVVRDIGDEDGGNLFLESFNRLPDRVQAQTFDAMLTDAYDQRSATPAEIEIFLEEDDAGETLVKEWGGEASYRLGVVKARTAKIFAGLSADEKHQLEHFITSAPEAEWTAILRQLGNPDNLKRVVFERRKRA